MDFGIIGVENIKHFIRTHLVHNNTHKPSETDELPKYFLFVSIENEKGSQRKYFSATF